MRAVMRAKGAAFGIMPHMLGVLSATGVLCAASAVVAADLPETPPEFSWAGPYFGIHGGYGWGDKVWQGFDGLGNLVVVNLPVSGGFGGFQVGRNYVGETYIYGYEGDFSLSGIRGSATGSGGATFTASVDWFATGTGRIGIAPAGWDRTLLYIKGGLAMVQDTFSVTRAATTVSRTDIHFGLTVGAGVEWALGDRWSLRAEYDYLNFSWNRAFDEVALGMPAPPPPSEWDIDQHMHLVKVGLNYRY